MSRGLPKIVKSCLAKALDSALLAIETYNKPAIKFRSGGCRYQFSKTRL